MSHMKYGVMTVRALCLLLCLLGCRPLPALAQGGDEAAIRTLIERFFAAYQKEDVDGLLSLWSEKSAQTAAVRQSLQQTFNEHRDIVLKRLNISRVTIEGDRAKAQLVVEMSALNEKTGKPVDDLAKMERTMQFEREGSGWKVSRYVSSEEDFATDLLATASESERKALIERNPERIATGLVRELNRQGRALTGQGKFTQALAAYEVALGLAGQLNDKAGASLVLIGVGNVHYLQGNYTRASEDYSQSLKLAEETGSRSDMARAWGSLGTLNYAQGNFQQALELYEKSLRVREELGDKPGISTTLGNIAGIYYAQGSYEQALEYQLRGLKLAEELGDKSGIATALNNVGAVYLIQGDYLRSLDMRQRSLKIREELGDKAGITQAYNSLGLVYYAHGDYEQALEHYQKSLQLSSEIGRKAGIAAVLNNIGNVYYAQGNYAQAVEFLLKALKLDEELEDKASIAATLNNLGAVYNEQGDYPRALETLQQSLKQAEALTYEQVIVSSLTNIAFTHYSTGKYQPALDYITRAIALARQGDDTAALWQALTIKGKVHATLEQFEPARQSFLDAIALIEKLRGQTAGGERGQQRFFEGKVSPYYAMVELLVKRQDLAQALLYAERAKGRVLLDVLSNGRVNIDKAMTAEELSRDKALTAEINGLNTQLSRLKSSPNRAELPALKARLEKARLEYEAFQTGLYAAHPELKVQRGEPHALGLDEAERLLPDANSALLEYVVGENSSYLFALTKGAANGGAKSVTLKVYTLSLHQKELGELTENFRHRIAERDLTVKAPAQHLYDLLVKPAEKQLQGVSKLIIVPDGPLWDLPFQALNRNRRGYLVEDYTISYAPSLSVLREMKRKAVELSTARGGRRSPEVRNVRAGAAADDGFRPELLALGNPSLNGEAVAKASTLGDEEALSPLPNAEREVHTLGELYGRARSKVLIGDRATEEEVKTDAGKYLLLHFAAHALLDDRNPMYSRIMLSHAGPGEREDGFLEAWELMRLELKAEMAVLSACQTARGRVGAGEGVIGMSWALFVAGCPTVVVSQWKVDSARTTDLMIEFHRNLLRRRGREPAMTKAEALRDAALKLLRSQYNHPAYWAGFILVGNES